MKFINTDEIKRSDMTHGMELEVVAEGLETFSQRQLLNLMGCDYIQDYYGKPKLFSLITNWIKENYISNASAST